MAQSDVRKGEPSSTMWTVKTDSYNRRSTRPHIRAHIPGGGADEVRPEGQVIGYAASAKQLSLKVLFDAEAAFHLEERPLAKDQRLTESGDGRHAADRGRGRSDERCGHD